MKRGWLLQVYFCPHAMELPDWRNPYSHPPAPSVGSNIQSPNRKARTAKRSHRAALSAARFACTHRLRSGGALPRAGCRDALDGDSCKGNARSARESRPGAPLTDVAPLRVRVDGLEHRVLRDDLPPRHPPPLLPRDRAAAEPTDGELWTLLGTRSRPLASLGSQAATGSERQATN